MEIEPDPEPAHTKGRSRAKVAEGLRGHAGDRTGAAARALCARYGASRGWRFYGRGECALPSRRPRTSGATSVARSATVRPNRRNPRRSTDPDEIAERAIAHFAGTGRSHRSATPARASRCSARARSRRRFAQISAAARTRGDGTSTSRRTVRCPAVCASAIGRARRDRRAHGLARAELRDLHGPDGYRASTDVRACRASRSSPARPDHPSLVLPGSSIALRDRRSHRASPELTGWHSLLVRDSTPIRSARSRACTARRRPIGVTAAIERVRRECRRCTWARSSGRSRTATATKARRVSLTARASKCAAATAGRA